MAERFGGRYSPGAGGTPPGAPPGTPSGPPPRYRVDPAGARVNLLYLPAAVLAVASLGGGPTTLALGLAGAAVWTGAAWLTREGLRAEAAWADRAIARRPALPRKILASLGIGAGAALAAASGGVAPAGAAIYGAVAAALHAAAFGIDPLRDKGLADVDRFQQDRVARAVDEAERHLAAMTRAAEELRDRPLEARVARFQDTARELFRTVENDPRDLTAARRYLSVYLQGARDATVKYAAVHRRSPNAGARADYLALLDDLEQNFAARTRKLLLDEHSDLTVEIEVLRDRLRREGLRHDMPLE